MVFPHTLFIVYFSPISLLLLFHNSLFKVHYPNAIKLFINDKIHKKTLHFRFLLYMYLCYRKGNEAGKVKYILCYSCASSAIQENALFLFCYIVISTVFIQNLHFKLMKKRTKNCSLIKWSRAKNKFYTTDSFCLP